MGLVLDGGQLLALLRTGLMVAIIIVVIVAVLLYLFQTRLIYIPQLPPGSREVVWQPSRFGWGRARELDEAEDGDWQWEDVRLTSQDGTQLRAYWIRAASSVGAGKRAEDAVNAVDAVDGNANVELRARASAAKHTILYMHANAGNMGHRLPIARKLQQTLDCNIFMLSYRGYGLSEGVPSETGIKMDAQTGLDFVWSRLGKAERERVAVYGQSIGGAVAIHLAATNPDRIRFVLVENTFLSIPRLIPAVMPALRPFARLCHQVWDNSATVQRVGQRILFLSGAKDELVPPRHMRELQTLAKRSYDRTFIVFDKGTHNDTCIQPGYFEAIEQFLLRAAAPPPRVKIEEVTDEDEL